MIECTVKTFCSFSESFYYYRYTLFNFLFHGLSLSIQKKNWMYKIAFMKIII